MEIKLQLPDAVYASLLKGNTRIQGSSALVSPREGNFNVYHKRKNTPAREYRKLPHGRVSINTESLRLTLNVALDEHGIIPAQILLSESQMASHFVQGMTMDEIPNH